MSALTRDEVDHLNRTAEDLLHQTWELFTQLRATNEALLQVTNEFTAKITTLSRSSDDGAIG